MLRRIIANIAQRFENSSIKAAMSEAMQAGDKRPADDLPVNEASSDKKAKEVSGSSHSTMAFSSSFVKC